MQRPAVIFFERVAVRSLTMKDYLQSWRRRVRLCSESLQSRSMILTPLPQLRLATRHSAPIC